jgi:hypothetical protein
VTGTQTVVVPVPEKVTLSWAIKNLPLTWYGLIFTTLVAASSAGFTLKSHLITSVETSNSILVSKLIDENHVLNAKLREVESKVDVLTVSKNQNAVLAKQVENLNNQVVKLTQLNDQLELKYFNEYQKAVLLRAENSLMKRIKEEQKN